MQSLTSALDRGVRSASCPNCLTLREGAPDTHWIGGWVGHSWFGHSSEEKNSKPFPLLLP